MTERPITAYEDVIKYASKNTEHAHQVALFMWFAHAIFDSRSGPNGEGNANYARTAILCPETIDYVYFHADILAEIGSMFAIPNGGLRDRVAASRLKAEGVKAGVADVFLPIPRHSCGVVRHHGLFIEMKRPKSDRGAKGRPSKEQEAFRDKVKNQGYEWILCETWHQAVIGVWSYLYE